MEKIIGYKIVFTTKKDREEIEDEIDEMLMRLSNKSRMDLVIEMSDNDVKECYKNA